MLGYSFAVSALTATTGMQAMIQESSQQYTTIDPCRRTGPERGVALAFMYPCVRDARVHVCVCIRPLALGRWLAGQTVGQLAWRLDWRDARARAVAGERRS